MNKLQQPARARIDKPNPIPIASPAEKSLTGTEIFSIPSNKKLSCMIITPYLFNNRLLQLRELPQFQVKLPQNSPSVEATVSSISSNKNTSSDICVTFFIKNYFAIDYTA